MSIVNIRGEKIYYKEYGQGAPLLLIAGLGSDSTSWLPVVIGLSKHFRVITFDNRGVGQSTQNNNNITIEDMADDAASLIKSLSLAKVNILGHSMGGMIAMKFALKYPDSVDKLIVAASCTKINNRNKELFKDMIAYSADGMDKRLWFRNLFYWIFSPKFFEDVQFLDQALNMAINYRFPQSDDSFKNQVGAITQFDCSADVSNLQAKTLIMTSDQDLLFPFSENSRLITIPNSKILNIIGAAHSIHMDEPQAFIDGVVSFL